MARKPKHEEHENHERWLVSYADFITLLFAFFVVMYSISSVNEGKYRVLSDAIVAAFKDANKSLKPIQIGKIARSPQSANLEFKDTANPISVPEGPVKMPSRANKTEGHYKEDEVEFSEFPMADERLDNLGEGNNGGLDGSNKESASAQLNRLADDVKAAMQPLIDRDLISVKRNKRWIEIEIKTSILFASGSARMQEQSLPVLEALARILRAFPNDMRIEGYTDNLPIKSQIYPSNWELSAARAASVVRLFESEGIAPERMAAIGYGEFRPLVSNDTLEGRIKNRRVVVVISASRYVRQVKPKPRIVLPEPEPETVSEVEAPPVNDAGVEASSVDESSTESAADLNDIMRLDALIDTSGLHRTDPVALESLVPPSVPEASVTPIGIPVWMPAPLISPPIKFFAPIELSPLNMQGPVSSPVGAVKGGE
ncbi:MAG TPA: flagellar motor protein MotD [Chromatiales bacterium]|nr:flagellar motor protein MotD [Chromatiales bacterium]